jgi:hypothetical protein
MELHSFFYLLFMKLSWFHGLDRGFNKLTRVDLVYLFLSFLIFFILQHWVSWKLDFIIFCICFLWIYLDLMTRVVDLEG